LDLVPAVAVPGPQEFFELLIKEDLAFCPFSVTFESPQAGSYLVDNVIHSEEISPRFLDAVDSIGALGAVESDARCLFKKGAPIICTQA
jgi:hypothetical protein